MRSHSARQKVYDELKKEFRRDRAVTKLLPMSDFGVVEITRQRLRPSITTTTNVDDLPPLEDLPEPQPAPREEPVEQAERPERSGPQPTSEEVVDHLDRWLTTYRAEVQDQHRRRPILIRCHPFLAAYLNRGIPSLLTRWRLRTRLKLRLDVDEAADPLAFSVRDEKSGKNLTKKYDPDRRDDS
jgi:ribonuclease G